MHQRSFGSVEYAHTKGKTRRQQFLERMDRLVPWEELEGRIAPVYPQRGRGRRPYPLRVMLRIHCLQLWFNLSDPGMEQELYDSRSMLEFAGLSLAAPIPDETTILHFRHLLERHQLGTALFATINAHLAGAGAAGARGHDRGLHDHQRAVLDEEPGAGARPRDASDPEGPAVVLRDEAPHRHGCAHRAGPQRAHDGGERLRRDRGASPVARRGDRGVGRCRLPGSGEAPGARGGGGALAGGDAARSQAAVGCREARRRWRRSARRRCGRRSSIRSWT